MLNVEREERVNESTKMDGTGVRQEGNETVLWCWL